MARARARGKARGPRQTADPRPRGSNRRLSKHEIHGSGRGLGLPGPLQWGQPLTLWIDKEEKSSSQQVKGQRVWFARSRRAERSPRRAVMPVAKWFATKRLFRTQDSDLALSLVRSSLAGQDPPQDPLPANHSFCFQVLSLPLLPLSG